jgi:adenosylmethionine-8-amino-7-oxononanoate aminotransferase
MNRETLQRWDDQYVWHPFTPHSVYRDEDPLLVVGGEGNYLIDPEGNRYLDGVASIWCNTFGHQRKEISDAIRAQLDRIAHATMLGNAVDVPIVLAKKLVDVTPDGLDKVFFSDNGSTASEIAIKMAYQNCQQSGREGRSRFMALGNAYNGDTIGAVSVGGVDLFHARFRPMLFECVRAPSPYSYRDPDTDFIGEFERLFLEHKHELAAVILEPGVQGAGGMITYPDGYLRRVRELTTEHDVLLIFDEVAVGMGRSGAMFASQKEGVTPDFLCIAKGLTGGYLPVAATITTQEVYDAFLGPPSEGRTFFHGHTFTGNALGCAAAIATLDIFENDDVIASLQPKIEQLHAELKKLERFSSVGEVRTYGMCAGVELVEDRETKAPYDPAERRGYRVCRYARDRGVFLRPLGDILIAMPPLSITAEEITALVDAMAYGIDMELGE